MSRLFISFSKDFDFAIRLQKALEARGFDVWIYLKDIPPTTDWLNTIYGGIESSDIFVFLISPDSIVSDTCHKEIEHADRNHKRIIPLVVRKVEWGTVRREISRIQAISFEGENRFEEAFEELLSYINTDFVWVQFHTKLQEKALDWSRRKVETDTSRLLRGRELREAKRRISEAERTTKDPQQTDLQREFILVSADVEKAQYKKTKEEARKLSETERQRLLTLSQRLGTQSLEHVSKNLTLALLLAHDAQKRMDTPESRNALLNSLLYNPRLVAFRYGGLHHFGVRRVIFNADGSILASGSAAKTVMLWNLVSPHSLVPLSEPLPGHLGPVLGLSFSPDGKTFASESLDYIAPNSWERSIILWDLTDPLMPMPLSKCIHQTHSTETGIVFSPDNEMLVANNEGTRLLVWDIRNRHSPKRLSDLPTEYDQWAQALSFIENSVISPDGKTRASGKHDGTISLRDVSAAETPNQFAESLTGHGEYVESLAFGADSKTLVSTDGDHFFIHWDLTRNSPLQIGEPLTSDSGWVQNVKFSPDGNLIASGNENHTVILWDATNRRSPVKFVESLNQHTANVSSVAFNPNGRVLASGDYDKTIILWDISRPASPMLLSRILDGHDGQVRSVVFSPNGKLLASCSNDCTVMLWDVTNPRLPTQIGEPLRGHTANVDSVAFSADGKRLISLGPSVVGQIREPSDLHSTRFGAHGFILWDISNPFVPKRLKMPDIFLGPTASIESMSLSHDGRLLGTRSRNGMIRLWEITNPRKPHLIVQLEEPNHDFSHIRALAFSPDGMILAGGTQNQIDLWDVRSPYSPVRLGTPLIGHSDRIFDLAFDPSGKTLASGSADGKIILWDLDALSWTEKACWRAGRNFTRAEWLRYFPNEEYRVICAKWPSDL
jgi:WD40 repeat protein